MLFIRRGLIYTMLLCCVTFTGRAALAQSMGVDVPNFGNISVDDYFDAGDLDSSMRDDTPDDYELRALDPEKDKASRFVIVEENYDENSLEARLLSAKRAIDLGRFEASLRIYQGLKMDYPDNKDVLIGYAAALQQRGQVDEAIHAYEDLLDKDPDNIDAHINMLGLVADRYPAVALQRLVLLDKKQATFNPMLIGQIAYVQAKLGRYDSALDSYAIIAAKEPHNPLHVLNMAIVADKAGLKKNALSYYEEALALDSIYGGDAFDRKQIFDRLARLR